jgi:hypothetical protein
MGCSFSIVYRFGVCACRADAIRIHSQDMGRAERDYLARIDNGIDARFGVTSHALFFSTNNKRSKCR